MESADATRPRQTTGPREAGRIDRRRLGSRSCQVGGAAQPIGQAEARVIASQRPAAVFTRGLLARRVMHASLARSRSRFGLRSFDGARLASRSAWRSSSSVARSTKTAGASSLQGFFLPVRTAAVTSASGADTGLLMSLFLETAWPHRHRLLVGGAVFFLRRSSATAQ
jgi:hypothetical protein